MSYEINTSLSNNRYQYSALNKTVLETNIVGTVSTNNNGVIPRHGRYIILLSFYLDQLVQFCYDKDSVRACNEKIGRIFNVMAGDGSMKNAEAINMIAAIQSKTFDIASLICSIYDQRSMHEVYDRCLPIKNEIIDILYNYERKRDLVNLSAYLGYSLSEIMSEAQYSEATKEKIQPSEFLNDILSHYSIILSVPKCNEMANNVNQLQRCLEECTKTYDQENLTKAETLLQRIVSSLEAETLK